MAWMEKQFSFFRFPPRRHKFKDWRTFRACWRSPRICFALVVTEMGQSSIGLIIVILTNHILANFLMSTCLDVKQSARESRKWQIIGCRLGSIPSSWAVGISGPTAKQSVIGKMFLNCSASASEKSSSENKLFGWKMSRSCELRLNKSNSGENKKIIDKESLLVASQESPIVCFWIFDAQPNEKRNQKKMNPNHIC